MNHDVLFFGELRETVWEISVLNETGFLPSVALDALGDPHVAYGSRGTQQNLMHATRVDGVWEQEVVHTPGDSGLRSDIEVDACGRVHIVFTSFSPDSIFYAAKESGSWSIDTLAANSTIVDDLAVGTDCIPHITYMSYPSITVIHGYKPAGGSWIYERVATGAAPAIEVDGRGHRHIAYNNAERLMYAYNDGSGWSTEVADASPSARKTSIGIDSQYRPHISHEQWINTANFNDPCCGHVKYATKRADGTWLNTIIDREGHGRGSVLRVDAIDVPRVVYHYFEDQVTNDLLKWDLRYAEPVLAPPSRLT